VKDLLHKTEQQIRQVFCTNRMPYSSLSFPPVASASNWSTSYYKPYLGFSDEGLSVRSLLRSTCHCRSTAAPISIRRWPTLRTRSLTRPPRARRARCPLLRARRRAFTSPRLTRPTNISSSREKASLSSRTNWILCLAIFRPTWAARVLTRLRRDAAALARNPS